MAVENRQVFQRQVEELDLIEALDDTEIGEVLPQDRDVDIDCAYFDDDEFFRLASRHEKRHAPRTRNRKASKPRSRGFYKHHHVRTVFASYDSFDHWIRNEQRQRRDEQFRRQEEGLRRQSERRSGAYASSRRPYWY